MPPRRVLTSRWIELPLRVVWTVFGAMRATLRLSRDLYLDSFLSHVYKDNSWPVLLFLL